MDDWRRSTWATAGMVVFVGFIGTGITWDATATPTRPLWPLWVFFGVAVFGLAAFVIAMARPNSLPGRTAAEREEKEREERRHKSELALESKKAEAKRFRDFFSFGNIDYDQRAHTEAMNRLTEELRRQRGAEPVWLTEIEKQSNPE
jgi:hypothetical protein